MRPRSPEQLQLAIEAPREEDARRAWSPSGTPGPSRLRAAVRAAEDEEVAAAGARATILSETPQQTCEAGAVSMAQILRVKFKMSSGHQVTQTLRHSGCEQH